MNDMNYQTCTKCIMDTTDSNITFDSDGQCNHCEEHEKITAKRWLPNDEGERKLKEIFETIKSKGRNHEYDCIIGLSGGVDSSYLALIMKQYGLRPLVVHVDAGWNSELAVNNIEQIVKYCDYDLHTHVMNWSEIKDLQLSYLRAGVANQDVVQDHAFFASMYHFAVENKIKYIISGGNIATESVFPSSWHHSAMDSINLKAIQKKFGSKKLNNYKTISFWKYYFYYPFIKGMKTIRPLDFLPYDKSQALEVLKSEVNYKEYGRKHGESRFTKFFQNHYLPVKFNYDKRKPHLSSLILSGQMTRDQAIAEMKKPLYEKHELNEDIEYVAKKLGLQKNELIDLIKKEGIHYSQYKNWNKHHYIAKKAQRMIEILLGKRMNNYS